MAAGDLALSILIQAQDMASNVIRGIGAGLGPIGIGMAAIGVAALAAGATAVKMAGDFQSMTTTLVTGAGESARNLEMVRQGLLNLSVATGTSVQQLTDGMFMIESAGYHGAAGLNVLTVAAEGARVGNADLGTVANALTTVMKDFGISANNSATAMNFLTAIVQNGKTTMQDLAASMSQVLPTASAVGVHLIDVGAAMATMTAEGVPAANAATYLRQMLISLSAPASAGAKSLAAIGLTTQQVSDEMKKSLPDTLQMIMQHLAQTYTVGSPEYVQALKNIAGGSKQMQGMLDLTGTHLKEFQANMHNVANTIDQGKGSVVGWTAVQDNFNFKMDQAKQAVNVLMIRIGTALLPILGQLFDKVTPVIKAFSDWLTKTNALQNGINTVSGIINQIRDAFNAVFGPIQRAITVVKPLTDSFDRATGILHNVNTAAKPLLDTFDRATGVFDKTGTSAHGAVQAINPFIAIFQGIANVIRFFISVYTTVSNIIQASIPVFRMIWLVMQQIGSFLVSTFTPVWKQLVTSFHDIQQALQPIMPQLRAFAQLLGGVLAVAIVLIISIIAGLISAFAGLLTGVAKTVTGIIQFFAGLVQFVSGVVSFIADLLTGHFDKLAGDLNNIMQGIMHMFIGVWNTIEGIFSIAFGIINGFASGFVSAIIAIFQDFANQIVGHSIIPDMINAIVSWFQQLPGRAIGAVQSLAGQLTGFFSGLASQAVSWGSNLIQGIINGINGMLGNVANAAGNVASTIAHFLGFASPTKEGPGRYADTWAPAFVNMYTAALMAGIPKVQSAFAKLTNPTGTNGAFALSATHNQAFALSGGNHTVIIQVQPAKADITMDHRKVGEGVMRYVSKELRVQGTIRNR